MLFSLPSNQDFSLYALRRKKFIEAVKAQHPGKTGAIVLFGAFEGERVAFRQESSVYYLSGLQEPGIVLFLDLTGKVILYVPNCVENRSKWVFSQVSLTPENSQKLGVDEVRTLGSQCAGYQFHPFFPREEYSDLLNVLEKMAQDGKTIFTFTPNNPHGYTEQRLLLQRLREFVPAITAHLVDVSPVIATMRRVKDMHEIDQMYKAVEITAVAQEAAASAISDGMRECEIQASLEYMMTSSGARTSFPSIVASGKNSTVLHYNINSGVMKNGDLVVVDIGAEFGCYAADLTRTYPVSGSFTKRQREIYNIVLETQAYIADLAKPGMWLSNAQHPEQSLNHLARAFLAKKGYEKYFPHGIGHFLGLDVHDVGDYSEPLQEGDIITIEPGIYIPEEQIGIRIEDDYWIVQDGVVCLSENLPKSADEVEFMVQQTLEDAEESDLDEEEMFEEEDENTEH
jgi:Xaa-Pro aminopeptidase